IDHPAKAVLVYAEHRLDDGHRGHHHEIAGAVDAVKLGHFCLVWIKVWMAAMRPSSVVLALCSPWVQHALIDFGPKIVCGPPQCGGMVNQASCDKSEDVGPSLPVALVSSKPQPSGLSPACVPSGPCGNTRERPSPRSGACDRDGDELRRVIRLQPHQDGALAILMGVADGIAHVRRDRNFLPAVIDNDFPGLE